MRLRRTWLACAVLAAWPLAHADPWARLEMDTTATATDNANQSPAGQERKDLSLVVEPRLQLRRFTPDLNLRLDLRADLVDYARHSQPDRALLGAEGGVTATVVPGWALVDAAIDTRQVPKDSFRPDTDVTSTANTRTATALRVSPVLRHALDDRWTVLARDDEALVSNASGSGSDQHSHQALLRVDALPLPLGGGVELSRIDADAASGNDSGHFVIDAARARVSAAFEGDWVLGLVGGREHVRLGGVAEESNIGGVTVAWTPTPRTTVTAEWEHRFFGKGLQLGISHRLPWLAVSLRGERSPVTAASAVRSGNDLASQLDQILTTRNPDVGARARLVDDMLFARGLQGALPGAVDVAAGYAQVQKRLDGSLVFLGVRNTLTLSAYGVQTRAMVLTNGVAAIDPSLATADQRQTGGRVEFSHRLSPRSTIDLSLDDSVVRGLGARLDDRTSEVLARASLVQNLSPRTVATVGLQHRRTHSNVAEVLPYRESQVVAGLSHRF
jgi:uncharacterized protein (PEP-CTERM system associated)